MLTIKIKFFAFLLLFLSTRGALLFECEEDILKRKLYSAIVAGDLKLVRELLSEGAYDVVNLYYYGRGRCTPLQTASRFGHVEIIEELIKAGALIDGYDSNEYSDSPLHIAASLNKCNVIKTLIELGAEINLLQNYRTPLYNAVKNYAYDAINILLKYGANYDFVKQENEKIVFGDLVPSNELEQIFKNHVDLVITKGSSEIVKIIPVYGIAKIIAQYLYQLGSAEVAKIDEERQASGEQIMAAVKLCNQHVGSAENGAYVEILTKVLKNCSNINYIKPRQYSYEYSTFTPLSLAAASGSNNAIKLLLKANADVNNFEPYLSALDFAVENHKTKTIKILLDAGAQIKNNSREHALDLAIKKASPELVFIILKHNNKTGEVDISKLHYYIQKIALIKKDERKYNGRLNKVIDLIAANFSDYLHTIATSFKYPLPKPLAKLIMEYLFLHTRYLEDEVVEPQKDAQSKCIIA